MGPKSPFTGHPQIKPKSFKTGNGFELSSLNHVGCARNFATERSKLVGVDARGMPKGESKAMPKRASEHPFFSMEGG